MRRTMPVDSTPASSMAALAAVLALAACAAGCHVQPDQDGFTPITAQGPAGPLVQLRCAKIPHIEAIAAHCWFVEWDEKTRQWTRWEVWQNAGSGGYPGHIRKRTGPGAATAGVGSGPSWALHEWTGEDAIRLRAVCRQPDAYPWTDTYAYWPGPNSNTYIAWVLLQANVKASLPPAAIGKGYLPLYFTGPKRPLEP